MSLDRDAERRQDDDVVGAEPVGRVRRGRERNRMPAPRSRSLTCGLWMISPVRKTLRPGNRATRLVGVVDGAIDAVAEAELAREVHGQPAGVVAGSRSARTRSTRALW